MFVLPSFQEGDSMAVKEAMGAGLPVIITPACHLDAVTEIGAGLVVAPTVDSVAGAITALARSEPMRLAMGAAGRDFIAREYTWPNLGRQFLEIAQDVVLKTRTSTRWCEP
jgi:glycosyltransferase involved in cell wall biosynthesis